MRRPASLKPGSCRISQGENGKDCFKLDTDGGFPYPDDYLSDGQDRITAHSILARDIWAVLLPGELLQDLDLTIIRRLLYSLN